jgi:hypothetical protein
MSKTYINHCGKLYDTYGHRLIRRYEFDIEDGFPEAYFRCRECKLLVIANEDEDELYISRLCGEEFSYFSGISKFNCSEFILYKVIN